MSAETDIGLSDEDYAKQFDAQAAERAGVVADEPDTDIDAAPEPAVVTDATPPSTDPEEKPAAPVAKKDDLWASAPAELRAAYEEMEQRYNGMAERARRDQIHLERLKAAPAAPAPATAKREVPAEVKKFNEDYPDLAGPTAMMLAPATEAVERIESRLQRIEQERFANHVAAQEDALNREHPDFPVIKTSKEFESWLIAQPAEIQQIAFNNSPHILNSASASKLVALFKAETRAAEIPVQTQPSLKRQKQLDSASVPLVRGPAPAPDNADDYAAQFAAEARARIRARAN